MKKAIRNLLLILFIALLFFSAWQVTDILRTSQASKDSYASLEQYVSFTEPASTVLGTEEISETVPPPEIEPEDSTAPIEVQDDTVWPKVDFEQLEQINPDIVGWLFIEGTNINYPVVQGEDNSYYLDHLFDETYNPSGCIFLDENCSSDFSDQHSIIYGHNMLDGIMFSSLTAYKRQEFYEQHPAALLLTPTHKYKIRLFSGYVAESSSNAWKRKFQDDSFGSWLSDITSRSAFRSESFPGVENRIITLSTCTYEFDSARFVLHGYIEISIQNKTE